MPADPELHCIFQWERELGRWGVSDGVCSRLSRRQEEEEEEEASWVLVGTLAPFLALEAEGLIPAPSRSLNSLGTDRKIIWSGDNKALGAANEKWG